MFAMYARIEVLVVTPCGFIKKMSQMAINYAAFDEQIITAKSNYGRLLWSSH